MNTFTVRKSTDADRKRGYFICPKCGSREILYESNWFDSNNNQLKVMACCEKCGKEWHELYRLTPQEITFESK